MLYSFSFLPFASAPLRTSSEAPQVSPSQKYFTPTKGRVSVLVVLTSAIADKEHSNHIFLSFTLIMKMHQLLFSS